MGRSSKGNEPKGSAVDSAVGGLLSWVAGKDSTARRKSSTDGALGEVLSWVTGKGGKNSKRG